MVSSSPTSPSSSALLTPSFAPPLPPRPVEGPGLRLPTPRVVRGGARAKTSEALAPECEFPVERTLAAGRRSPGRGAPMPLLNDENDGYTISAPPSPAADAVPGL